MRAGAARAATVLAAVAGYDPRDPATAAGYGQIPDRSYLDNVEKADLHGVRLGVVREFMKVHTKADEDALRSPRRCTISPRPALRSLIPVATMSMSLGFTN